MKGDLVNGGVCHGFEAAQPKGFKEVAKDFCKTGLRTM